MNLDSTNRRILILSDPHQEIEKMMRIIKAEAADEVVCLGDWFDSFFNTSKYHIEQTCAQLARFVCTPNCHTLWGNHDLHYFYPSQFTMCTGYTKHNEIEICNYLGVSKHTIADKFKWYIKVDDFLCTHAGIATHNLNQYLATTSVDKQIEFEAVDANIKLKTEQSHWFYRAGKARGGKQQRGGIVWLDFDNEFEPIQGLKQIVGHTYSKTIRPHRLDSSFNSNEWLNFCIDCNLNEYIIIDNKVVQVKRYIDL